MNDSPDVLTRLSNRVDQLESRVYHLEHRAETSAAVPEAISTAIEVPDATEPLSQTGTIFPVLGRAMLGMAGAYALRALAESGSFPKLAAVSLAIAYAAAWLLGAVRVSAEKKFASATYAATSALILAPMLWELTLRFHFLAPTSAAAVLAAYVCAAYALAWKRKPTPVHWVATLTTAITAISLLIATHEILPFLAVILLMSLLTEAAAGRSQELSVRPIAAIAADIAIWALLFTYSSPESSHPDYPSLSTTALLTPVFLLLLIYGANIALRTILRWQTITIFETGQAIGAFLLAADATLQFAPAAGVTLFGIACFLFSTAAYTATFLRFDGIAERRNHHVYATWSAALLLVGCFWSLPSSWLPFCLGTAAIAATALGAKTSRLTLAFHGTVYLVAAALAADAFVYAAHALAGAFPAPPAAIVWIISAVAILCYFFNAHIPAAHWKRQLAHLLSASLAVTALATILISAMVWLTATVITPGASHVAVIRTLTACALALGLAFTGSRWQRVELVWIAYATLALVTAKLLFEDLRQGHPEFIAASIFLYALTLILVPRVVRKVAAKPPAAPLGSLTEPIAITQPR